MQDLPLRVCKICGLKAHSVKDLDLFARGTDYTYNRLLLCKKCFNRNNRKKRELIRLSRPKPIHLRKCRICGLEAKTENDLILFTTDKNLKYGKMNICKKCYNKKRVINYIDNPDRKNKLSEWHYKRSIKTKFKRKLIASGRPILCYFCGREITILEGRPHKDSLIIHSLDGNHNNWDDNNKVPAHHNCHMSHTNIGVSRNSGINHPMFGKHQTEKWRQMMSKINKGKIISDETRKRMSESAKRRFLKILEEY